MFVVHEPTAINPNLFFQHLKRNVFLGGADFKHFLYMFSPKNWGNCPFGQTYFLKWLVQPLPAVNVDFMIILMTGALGQKPHGQ